MGRYNRGCTGPRAMDPGDGRLRGEKDFFVAWHAMSHALSGARKHKLREHANVNECNIGVCHA